MAMKISAGAGVGRSDLFFVDPSEVLMNETLNGRCKPHDDKAVVDMAYSLVRHGQQQPITVRRVANNQIQVVAGYRRLKGAKYANEFLSPEKPIKIQCRVVDCSDEEALVKNIVENEDREATSVIDAAVNQRRLREDYGWSDEKIAELYRRKIQTIERMASLLRLPKKIQNAIHSKGLSVSAALYLLDLDPEKQEEILASHTEANGHVNGKAVKAAAMEANGKHTKVTVTVARKFFRGFCGDRDDERLKTLCESFESFLGGELDQDGFGKVLDKLFR